MKRYFFAIVLFTFPFSIFANTTDTVSAQLKDIGIYLNHQNFQKAQEIRKDIMKNLSIDTLSKELSYIDFVTLLQTISWDTKGDDFYELIHLREIYHPEDAKNATLLTHKSRTEYWKNCSANKILFIDSIDWAMCIIYNNNITLISKKALITNFISKNYSQVLNGNDIQAMSDFGNLISVYIDIDPRKKVQFSSYQKKIGFQIIKKDPSWVNGYFFMISNSRVLKEQNNWIKELTQNYVGDEERWKEIVIPYIDYYQ